MKNHEARTLVNYLVSMFRRWNNSKGPSEEERIWWRDQLMPLIEKDGADIIDAVVAYGGINPNRKIMYSRCKDARRASAEYMPSTALLEFSMVCVALDDFKGGQLGNVYRYSYRPDKLIDHDWHQIETDLSKELRTKFGGYWKIYHHRREAQTKIKELLEIG